MVPLDEFVEFVTTWQGKLKAAAETIRDGSWETFDDTMTEFEAEIHRQFGPAKK